MGVAFTALLLLFAALVALRVYGFSLAAWHEVIDGSAPSEVLLGEPRRIRSDDWKMQLPLLLSQTAQTPRFPLVNPSVGLGILAASTCVSRFSITRSMTRTRSSSS